MLHLLCVCVICMLVSECLWLQLVSCLTDIVNLLCKCFKLQDGYYIVVQDKDAGHNITGIPQSAGYTVFPGVDVPGNYDMKPVDVSTPAEPNLDLSCSMNRFAPNITQVNACAKGRGICCIDTGLYLVRSHTCYTLCLQPLCPLPPPSPRSS